MTDYSQEYYFIRSNNKNGRLPFLVADTNTEERWFSYEPVPVGSAPLIFTNGWKEEYRERGITDEAADILFNGSDLVVRDHIRERLLQYDIPNLHIHPAIYIDDRDKWHEDYWYLTFSDVFDCWDREGSDYEDDPVEAGDAKLYSIYTFALDAKILDPIPLKDRLLFKLGGCTLEMAVCHESIAGIFRGDGKSGARLQLVADY